MLRIVQMHRKVRVRFRKIIRKSDSPAVGRTYPTYTTTRPSSSSHSLFGEGFEVIFYQLFVFFGVGFLHELGEIVFG